MIQKLDLSKNQSNIQCTNLSIDALIAKNIIDILFASINENLKKDRNMTAFMKGIVSSQLPGIRDGSKNFINDMNQVDIKILLDSIHNQLKNRR